LKSVQDVQPKKSKFKDYHKKEEIIKPKLVNNNLKIIEQIKAEEVD